MDSEDSPLTYVQDKPDVLALISAYESTLFDSEQYSQHCREAYDARRNMWPGKASDLRKHGADAFPWDGASDIEVHTINERINKYIALFMGALNRAHIRAYPVEFSDISRAKVLSSFLRWMTSSYIPDFKRQMEIGANNLLEKGIAVTYVGWKRSDRTFIQKLDLQQIGQLAPQIVPMVMSGDSDDKLVQLMKQMFNGVSDKKAKKAIKSLRKTGFAELPIVRRSVDCPCVESRDPSGDVIFPNYTTDYQQSPYCFNRVLMTAQQLRNKISTDGWNEAWVDYIIEHCKENPSISPRSRNDSITYRSTEINNSDLYEVIYAYQRLIDEDDNSEGIYLTVFSQKVVSKFDDGAEVPDYAVHELLNGYEDYPFIVTKLSEDNKRLYDVQSFANMLRGLQWQIKVERDSRIDRNALATLPPIMHPAGNPPTDWRPGGFYGYKRGGEIAFGPQPAFNPGSVEMENTQILQADKIVGLDLNNPVSSLQQQFYVDKFLTHVRDVLRMAYKCYQRFGPDAVFFRVTGVPDPQRFTKGDPNENFDIVINFDVLQNDPENIESQLQQFVSLIQLDRNGRIDVDMLLEAGAAAINPLMADSIIRPAGQAQQQVIKDVTDDLSKIYSAIEVGARPNGAQIALQAIQQYVQQPDVSQRLMQDEAFKTRLEKYAQQYQFQMQQAQNAQIGRVGTAPAQMGGMQTQGIQQYA